MRGPPARDLDINLDRSWMISDSDIDIEAGKNAGCKTVRLQSRADETPKMKAELSADSLLQAVNKILQQDGPRPR